MAPFSSAPLFLTPSCLSNLHQEPTRKIWTHAPCACLVRADQHCSSLSREEPSFSNGIKNYLRSSPVLKADSLSWVMICISHWSQGSVSDSWSRRSPDTKKVFCSLSCTKKVVCELLQWSAKELTARILIPCTQGLNSEHMLSRKRRNLDKVVFSIHYV